jgi:hypothetical protein
MSALPVRDLADAPLAPLFEAAGCPLCRRVDDVAARFVDGILAESVNDVQFRGELDAARGFCPTHVHRLLQANRERVGGTLSSAILLGAVLRVRRRELAGVRPARGRSRAKRLEAAARPADCPVCGQAARGLSNAVGSLVRLSADPAWADALAHAPFCLAHLVRLLAAPDRPASFEAIEAAQHARLDGLQERIDGLAHHSAQDRRHLLTDEERASVDEAAAALGGS